MSTRARRGWLACLLGLLCAGSALPAVASEPDASEDSREEERYDTEFSMVPFVGGNSDVGFGGGYIATLARLEPRRDPYLYRVDTTGSATFQGDGEGGLRLPYADVLLRWKFPHVIPNRLGIEVRASYTRETNLHYYGLGNASRLPGKTERGDPYFEHSRVHPSLRLTWEYQARPLVFSWGASYTQNWLDVSEQTLLADDFASPRGYVRELVGDAGEHGVPAFSFGAAWDTRDDEVAPGRGVLLRQDLNWTPGTLGETSYRFARWTSSAAVFAPLVSERRRLVLALRLATDLLLGNAPFYELARFGDSYLGGSKGVRGVPAQRYYGKAKILANAELRSELISGRVLGVRRRLGVVAFLDTGRIWADYASHPDLDGRRLGLAYGLGAGLRIASGKTFLLRLDGAWSPEAGGLSGYLIAGHAF